MSSSGLVLSYNRDSFNALPGIEIASTQAQQMGALDIAITALAPIFRKHDMCGLWAIGLSHKHYMLHEFEIPLQQVLHSSASRELVTSAQHVSSATDDRWPSVMALRQGRWIVLEYSNDVDVRNAYVSFERDISFQTEVADSLIAIGLAHVLSLVVVRDPLPECMFVEFNDDIERTSTLREVPCESVSGLRFLETSWRFYPHSTNAYCQAVCNTRCETQRGEHVWVHRTGGHLHKEDWE